MRAFLCLAFLYGQGWAWLDAGGPYLDLPATMVAGLVCVDSRAYQGP